MITEPKLGDTFHTWDNQNADDHRGNIYEELMRDYYEIAYEAYCKKHDYDPKAFGLWLLQQDNS